MYYDGVELMLQWGLSQSKLKGESLESKEDLYDQLEDLVVREQQVKQRIRQLNEVAKESENGRKAQG